MNCGQQGVLMNPAVGFSVYNVGAPLMNAYLGMWPRVSASLMMRCGPPGVPGGVWTVPWKQACLHMRNCMHAAGHWFLGFYVLTGRLPLVCGVHHRYNALELCANTA